MFLMNNDWIILLSMKRLKSKMADNFSRQMYHNTDIKLVAVFSRQMYHNTDIKLVAVFMIRETRTFCNLNFFLS